MLSIHKQKKCDILRDGQNAHFEDQNAHDIYDARWCACMINIIKFYSKKKILKIRLGFSGYTKMIESIFTHHYFFLCEF